MPFATIDGIRTRFEIVGEGPPLLMFSPGGFDASLDKWTVLDVYKRIKLLEHLPKKFRCIVFDRRETGQSGARVERITWSDYARQGEGLLDHLGLASAHLLGGCMGCCPVTTFAVQRPERVRSMVLFWPVGGPRFRIRGHERFRTHLALVERSGLSGVVEAARQTDQGFGRNPAPGPWAPAIRSDAEFAAAYAALHVERYKLLVTAMARTLLDRDTAPGAEPEDLMRLDIPSLIVPGRDVAHATSAARYLEECLQGAEYWDVLPDELNESNVPDRILRFLERAEESARARGLGD
jgi:pimeloyl-ACP methyl ester carboxylesterase